ncbi:T9SS type A sorting domain-containing protein [bacterium]|nr:T9SS type A sorting domain-containing protein [bacterium]
MVIIVSFLAALFLFVQPAQSIEVEWVHTLDENTHAQELIHTPDDGLLILSQNNSFLTRLDSNLDVLWRLNIFSPFEEDEFRTFKKVLSIPNGNFVVLGRSTFTIDTIRHSDIFFIEVSGEGDSLNYIKYTTELYDDFCDALLLENGNYLVLRETMEDEMAAEREYWLDEINSEGEVISETEIQRPVSGMRLEKLLKMDEEYFYIGGLDYPDVQYAHLRKYDSNLDEIWRHNYRGVGIRYLMKEQDGNIGIFSEVYSEKIKYLKVDDDGEELVNVRYKISNMRFEYAVSLFGDGSKLVCAQVSPPNTYILCHIGVDGDSLESVTLEADSICGVECSISDYDGGILIAGRKNIAPSGRRDLRDVIMKIAPLNNNEASPIPVTTLPATAFIHSAYPNPFNNFTRIRYVINDRQNVELSVFDLCGKQIATLDHGERSAGVYNLIWNAEGMPSGIYLVKLDMQMTNSVVKVVLVQ